ncbi:hypothetical protein AB0K47_03360 [Streptomyces tirandamycinicus]|uniref:hypothetical protein n=1 Tax=Streptomyces tirandamycinicus TaxID=2174846 RepID=UPI00341B2327
MSIDELTAAFRDVDWQELEQVHDASAKALPALSNPVTLGALWDRMEKDENLARSAESFNAFQKYVLHDDASTGLRLRLHIFNEHTFEEAHNHRASFSSLILRGSYRHALYGNVEDVWGGEDEPATAVKPRFIQEQTAGTSYTIHHAFVHSTYAIPGTVSLVIQGPRDRASFRIYDLAQGITRTRVGGNQAQVVQEPGERKLGPAELQSAREELARLGLLA